MAASASKSTNLTAPNTTKSHFTLTASFSETGTSVDNNTSTLSLTAKITSDQYPSFYSANATLDIYWFDNNNYSNGTKVGSLSVPSMTSNDSKSITKTLTVTHRSDGSLKGYAKAIWTKSGSNNAVPASGNVSTAETALTSIARTPVFTTNPVITSISETSITINRGVTNISSNFSYSISPSAGTLSTSGDTATYTGLSANTAYTITVTAKNSANTSLTTTKQISTTTWAYPSITSLGSTTLTPGNTQTIYLNNPHGRSVTWYMRMNSTSTSTGTQVTTGTSTGTSIVFTPNADTLFNSNGLSTNKTSINAFYYITYSGQTSSKTGTIAITEAAYRPTWGSVAANNAILYKDIDSATTKITGSNQILVTSKSKIQYTKSSDYNATAVRSTISKYQMSLDGSDYTDVTANTYIPSGGTTVLASATSVKIYLRAVDARGYKSDPLVRTISGNNLKVYTNPTGTIVAQRENNYGTTILLNIKPTWSINSNNKKNAVWAYKEGTGTSGTFTTGATVTTFNSNISLNPTFNNNKTYTFRVQLEDSFGGKSNYLYTTVGPGVPIFMIDSATNSVGCQCFPRAGSALDVAGPAYFSDSVQFDGVVQNEHYAAVGQSSNTAEENTWYKFASIEFSAGYADRNILFKVYTGYGDNANAIGELAAHVRTKSDRSYNDGVLKWITAGSGIDTSKFKMAYFNDTSGTNTVLKVELWADVDVAWRRYKFIPIAEGDGSGNERAGQWTLYQTSAASGQSAPTAGYTLITSTLGSLKNSISGNASTATTAYQLAQETASRITTPNFDHEYIKNRATKRLDTATGSITEADPGDGWIETYFWDNTGAYDTQLYIPNSTNGRLKKRARANAESWPSTWQEIAYYSDVQEAKDLIPEDSGWKNISRASGYNAGSLGTPQYKKVGNQVFIRGSWSTSNNIGSSSVTLGTLPSGYRPPYDTRWIVSENGTGYIGRVGITTSGDIKLDWFGNIFGSRDTTTFTNIITNINFWVD